LGIVIYVLYLGHTALFFDVNVVASIRVVTMSLAVDTFFLVCRMLHELCDVEIVWWDINI
jgi:hypothetical protein